jgi:hypothetical protein
MERIAEWRSSKVLDQITELKELLAKNDESDKDSERDEERRESSRLINK